MYLVILLLFFNIAHASLTDLEKCHDKSLEYSKKIEQDENGNSAGDPYLNKQLANDAQCNSIQRQLEKGGKKVSCITKPLGMSYKYKCSQK